MARPRTRTKVHEAVLALAREGSIRSITMEAIAARAEVSKQTLYRSWSSTGAILFDALLARSLDENGVVTLPDTGDLTADLHTIASAMVAELTDRTQETLLRAVTAQLQDDEALAAQYRESLFDIQRDAVAGRLAAAGVDEPDEIAELFFGPILHRWLLRTRPFDDGWVRRHVERTVRAAAAPR
jgi:AcrR family transcriptional regulator